MEVLKTYRYYDFENESFGIVTAYSAKEADLRIQAILNYNSKKRYTLSDARKSRTTRLSVTSN